jgi:hypothetical protein
MWTDTATEMSKLTVNLHNFANAPKNYSHCSAYYENCEDSHFLGCDNMYAGRYVLTVHRYLLSPSSE